VKEETITKEPDAELAYLQEGVSVEVNPPFRSRRFIANKQLIPEDIEKLESVIPPEEQLQIVIVGDLNIKSQYARSLLAVTDKQVYGFDDTVDGGVRRESYEQISRVFVKRHYGNAMLVLCLKEDEKQMNFLRFSYREANLFDAAAGYITNIAAGGDAEEGLAVVKATFEKQFSVCPKCGRTLIRPGAPCMKCQSRISSSKSWVST